MELSKKAWSRFLQKLLSILWWKTGKRRAKIRRIPAGDGLNVAASRRVYRGGKTAKINLAARSLSVHGNGSGRGIHVIHVMHVTDHAYGK
jgi:hypothetical protein